MLSPLLLLTPPPPPAESRWWSNRERPWADGGDLRGVVNCTVDGVARMTCIGECIPDVGYIALAGVFLWLPARLAACDDADEEAGALPTLQSIAACMSAPHVTRWMACSCGLVHLTSVSPCGSSLSVGGRLFSRRARVR